MCSYCSDVFMCWVVCVFFQKSLLGTWYFFMKEPSTKTWRTKSLEFRKKCVSEFHVLAPRGLEKDELFLFGDDGMLFYNCTGKCCKQLEPWEVFAFEFLPQINCHLFTASFFSRREFDGLTYLLLFFVVSESNARHALIDCFMLVAMPTLTFVCAYKNSLLRRTPTARQRAVTVVVLPTAAVIGSSI